MSVPIVAVIVGAIFLVIGLIGGGIKIGVKEGEASIPTLNLTTRILSFIIGTGFIVFGLWRDVNPPNTVSTPLPTQTSAVSTEAPVVTTTFPASTPWPVPLSTVTRVNTAIVNQVCQALIGVIPNSPEDVRTKFGIPANKDIRVLYELCQEAPNGFVVEESSSLFTLEVPSGGCIDSYSGAKFSDATVPEQLGGGRRAYSGTVTTTSLTYRIAGCELKP